LYTFSDSVAGTLLASSNICKMAMFPICAAVPSGVLPDEHTIFTFAPTTKF
jgi:hypothetical protein